jgi:hypothetical protein
LELQSLVLKSWRHSCLRTSNFKLPHLESFNEKRDPHKYLTTLNTQASTIRAIETLRFKQFSSTFKEAVLQFVDEPSKIFNIKFFILCSKVHLPILNELITLKSNYATSLFNVWQDSIESQWKYMGRLNTTTIYEVNPN